MTKSSTIEALITTSENRLKKLKNNKEFCHIDQFCSGLVTKITQTTRRIQAFPFQICLISHTGLVLETTRNLAYYVEFCEKQPIMVHNVTEFWKSRTRTSWKYGNFRWKYTETYQVPVMSYNVQYVAQKFQAISQQQGEYILSGNNCHYVAEAVLAQLKVRSKGSMYYGSILEDHDQMFDPLVDIRPVFQM